MLAVDDVAVEVADDHRRRGELVVGHPGRLDHHEVLAGHPPGDVARGPGDQPVAGELAVQARHRLAQRADGGVDRGQLRHRAPFAAAAARRRALSRCITSLAPRPK